VLQRVYKFGGQPFVRDYLARHHGDGFDRTFGKGKGKAIMHATAGSIVGIGEIVLLPLDVLKIKRQTNPEAFRGRGLVKIVSDEGFGLYRGWGWTAARNAPGSFAVRLSGHDRCETTSDLLLALRWLCGSQGIPLQTRRLQLGFVEPELCRLHRRCQCVAARLGPARCHQDPHPKPEF